MRRAGKLPNGIRRSVVVEVFDHNNHYVVTSYEDYPCIIPFDLGHKAALAQGKSWHFFYVRKPIIIDFGDELLYNTKDDSIEVMRGMGLHYKLNINDPFPDDLLNRLVRDRLEDKPPHQPRWH